MPNILNFNSNKSVFKQTGYKCTYINNIMLKKSQNVQSNIPSFEELEADVDKLPRLDLQ